MLFKDQPLYASTAMIRQLPVSTWPGYLQVRCCCDPGKLLGWAPLPAGRLVRNGDRVTFRLPLEPVAYWRSGPSVPSTFLELEAAEWHNGHGELGLAFKSNDTPLETLRRIPGWVEHE